MPPSRRQSKTATPAVRRPRVAGLRRPGSPAEDTAGKHADLDLTDVPELEVEDVEALGYVPPVWQAPADRVDTDEPELAPEPEAQTEVEVISAPVIGDEPEPDEVAEPAPRPRPGPRPSGKRRATGSARPSDLAGAETEVASKPLVRRATAPSTTLTVAIGLAVVAVILAGLAVWFRGEANSRSDGADVNNKALIDAAASSDVTGAIQKAVESSFSYNYTDLDSTAKAVKDNLAGKALCQYDKLYGQVQKLAPEQKLVLTTRVVKVGLTRLEADRASMLVFLDQTTTRADQNQTTASGAQIGVDAERQGGKWKITNINMLGQPLPNGQPAPQC